MELSKKLVVAPGCRCGTFGAYQGDKEVYIMTRKHFQAIADILKNADLTDAQRSELARLFAVMCRRSNPGFQRSRFLTAAGVS